MIAPGAATPERLADAACDLLRSAARDGFRGPDPYDGLWFDWPDAFVAGKRRRQVLMQLHARSPFDIRRLYRRTSSLIPKTLGAFASVGLRLHELTGSQVDRDLAVGALEIAAADRSAGSAAWGYPWSTQTRWSFYPAGSPNVVATTFVAAALLESRREDLVARGRHAAEWVLDELWVEPDGYFAYHPGRPPNIHNASLLGAWLVHAGLPHDVLARERVPRAIERTLATQRADGSFPYGEGSGVGWVDSFHTGYVLTCLQRMAGVDPRVGEAVERGARHYERFFDEDGRARLWAHRPYPEDGHSAGTGMTTLSVLVRAGVADRALLERVAQRTLARGLRDGHAIHRRYRWGPSTVRYVRWADAHVALGLADAALALAGRPDVAGARLPT